METPCDLPQTVYKEDGTIEVIYVCPYEKNYTGYESEMCRNCCGLGVDE